MNLYEKLACARVELQNRNLKKSGHNKFAGFDYYELKDLMPAINEIMAKYKMLGVCSFHADYATLSIFDAEEPESVIVIKSPHAEAELKGCQPIQCLGGEETYQRRYLWMAAMEIVEGDALDANVGRPEKKEKVTQTDDDPLGAVDDEGALLGHDRDVAHVDPLGDLGAVRLQQEVDIQRSVIDATVLDAVDDALLLLAHGADLVGDELQRHLVVEALDGEDLHEDLLQALALALLRRHVALEEVVVGLELHPDQVGDFQHVADTTEIDSVRHVFRSCCC